MGSPPQVATQAAQRAPPFWASQKLIIPVNIAPIEDLIALLSRNPTVLDKLSVCTVSPHNDITPKAKMTSRKNEEICAYRFWIDAPPRETAVDVFKSVLASRQHGYN